MVLRSIRALPHWFGLCFPTQGSQHIATLLSTGLSILLYVGSGMNLFTISYVFSFAIFLQLLLVSHINCHKVVSDLVAVRGILPSPGPLQPAPPALGNVQISDAFRVNHPNFSRQHRAWVRGCPLLAFCSAYPLHMRSPISFGVGATSFAVVCIALLVTNAQQIILRLALRLYSASTLRQRGFTQIWYQWYKARSTPSVYIWIKNDSVRLSFEYLHLFCYTV